MGSSGRLGSVTTMPSELADIARSFIRASSANIENSPALAADTTAPTTSPAAPLSGS